MKEEFVTYNQALALKELGFDEDCLSRWLAITEWEEPTGEIKLQLGVKVEDYDKNQCLAPLKQQVFRWFREKYGYWSYNKEATKVTCRFYIEKFDEKFFNSGLFGSYEEAESACIDKLIEMVKKK